ncbi:hypothetical protein LTR94_035250, partial [Friedmanniomyces endolithicus]
VRFRRHHIHHLLQSHGLHGAGKGRPEHYRRNRRPSGLQQHRRPGTVSSQIPLRQCIRDVARQLHTRPGSPKLFAAYRCFRGAKSAAVSKQGVQY